MTTAAPARSSREQFDRQAAHYDQQWADWNRESIAWMIAQAQQRGRLGAVLDVATGTGFTALAFAPLAESVIGLDVSTGMLQQARERAEAQGITNLEWLEGPAESIPCASASFDVVCCRIAAHHFLDADAFLRESLRVLHPGGLFLLADTCVPDAAPEADAWQNALEAARDPSHVRNRTPGEWWHLVAESGLAPQAMTAAGGGIELPLDEWLFKAGTSPAAQELVHRLLATAPESARRAFAIAYTPEGPSHFTLPRVLLSAGKPLS